jgi:hypothetical protein
VTSTSITGTTTVTPVSGTSTSTGTLPQYMGAASKGVGSTSVLGLVMFVIMGLCVL